MPSTCKMRGCQTYMAVCTILLLLSPSLACSTRKLQNTGLPVAGVAAPTAPVVAAAPVAAVAATPAAVAADFGVAVPAPVSTPLRQLNKTQLTAPDGFVYDFKLGDVDYIQPLEALPHDNLTSLPPVPAADATTYSTSLLSDNPLMTWRLSILQQNKLLWDSTTNSTVNNDVNSLIEQADSYMEEAVYLVTNKSDAQSPWEDNPDPRVYFSLSDYYWPFQVSSVNPNGLPYRYNATVNPKVYDLTPNKRHLELTIEHISTLALAHFFTGNQAYAERARQKADAWFLNPETAMVAKYAGRLAGVQRGGTQYGRPEGVFDMKGLPELLNGVTLLANTSAWSESDTKSMVAWVRDYVSFLEDDPVAKYARMMGNYIATNVDEQLLAAYLYLSTEADSAIDLEEALKIAHFSELRQQDQIIDGVFRYERERFFSLELPQQCLQSWVNIAIMSERVGVDVWSRGSGEGWSIQEALDYNLDLTEDSSIAYPLTQGEDSTSPPSPAQSPASSPSSDTASEADAEPEAGSVSRSVCASSTNQAVLALVLLATTMVLYVHE